MPGEDFIDLSSDHDHIESQKLESIETVRHISDKLGVDDKECDIKEYSIHESSVQKNVESENTFTVVEEKTIQRNGSPSHKTESSPSVTRIKRSRTPVDEHERPCVRVVYKSLSRASRKKLEEVLQDWSKWHARNAPSSDVSIKEEALQDGEETYFPALYADQEKSTYVSFREDKRTRVNESGNLDSEWVPLYDRGFSLTLSSEDSSAGPVRVEAMEASRCFNCGAYSHSLKDCPRPRDSAAISVARRQHSSRKNSSSGQRSQSRYYPSSGGKYDGITPGVLGPELREFLGIGEFDPPPWLERMRELGYPPGYLEEEEDEPSGITIYADEEDDLEYEEGELPEKGEPQPPEKKKMTVDFPGVNAPIPDKADLQLWAAPPGSGRISVVHRLSLSRTPSYVERDRERRPVSYDEPLYFSDRWSGSGAAIDSPTRRDHHGHHYHHHYHRS